MLSDLGEAEPPKWRNNLYIFFNREERKKYYAHIKKSISKPHKYLSLIIDGKDQGKSHLPHFVQKSKVYNALLSNNTIPYHTIPYHTIPYHTTPYHTIPHHTIPYLTNSS
jgi:hypothetical protein